MVCSRRFWTAPSAERWVDTFWIAFAMVLTAASAFVESVPFTCSPFTPMPLALIDSKDTSILFSAVVSAPTWKLKIKAFSEELSAVLPDAPIASFTLTSASASRSLRFPVYVPVTLALVDSTFNCLLIVAEPVALFWTSIPYEFAISVIVFVTSLPFFSVTVAFVPSEVILTTFWALVLSVILKLVSSLETTSTVPILISAPSVNLAAVLPFAATVTPSTVPKTSFAAKVFSLPFEAASPFNR